MDVLARPQRPLKILIETRPALDKHAGIPQQTRLLFRGLSLIDDFCVEGLLQSSTHALARGLPRHTRGSISLAKHRQIDRLARVVIMLEQKFYRSNLSSVFATMRRLLGRSEDLTRFDSSHFRDFIWRRLFARSLPPADFDVATRAGFRVARTPWTAMHISGLVYKTLGLNVYPRLNTSGFDVMIAETPYPATVSKGTRLVIRYHDAIPLLMPHTISDRRHHQLFHYRALRRNVESGAWFVCVSEATRNDLLSIFPQVEARSLTIHNMVSHDFFDEESSPSRVPEIVRTRFNPIAASRRSKAVSFDNRSKSLPYLLMVSTVEPRKNHLTLLSAWERARATLVPGLKLILVGSLGWHQDEIVSKLSPWIDRGEIFMLEDVPTPELRVLYKHARATICPSYAEGFDLSGVEAMMSGGVVVASDIAVHQEIYSDGAEFFNPYSADDLLRAIQVTIDSSKCARRDELVVAGARIARRYGDGQILPQWQNFLESRVVMPT